MMLYSLLPQQQTFPFTWKHVSQPYRMITKHCHPLAIVLGDNSSSGNLWEMVNCMTIGKLITKKFQSQSFSSDEMIIPSSSCGAVSTPQDALVRMVGAVGRIYKQCEECCSFAFCPHNCWALYMCVSTIPLLFSISHLLKQGLAYDSCVCHMYILYMSQLHCLVHPSASPSAFQMIP